MNYGGVKGWGQSPPARFVTGSRHINGTRTNLFARAQLGRSTVDSHQVFARRTARPKLVDDSRVGQRNDDHRNEIEDKRNSRVVDCSRFEHDQCSICRVVELFLVGPCVTAPHLPRHNDIAHTHTHGCTCMETVGTFCGMRGHANSADDTCLAYFSFK